MAFQMSSGGFAAHTAAGILIDQLDANRFSMWTQTASGAAGTYPSTLRADNIPSVRESIILNQSSTISLTERPNRNDEGFQGQWVAWIDLPFSATGRRYHLGDLAGEPGASFLSKFHNGHFNYLFVDGHVEGLNPAATSSMRGDVTTPVPVQDGMWSIRAGD